MTLLLGFTWTWLPLFFRAWVPRRLGITLPVEIYELSVWSTITARVHPIISPEGLLPPMSSHLYLWHLECDLVWPHFDKSHLELINMGDTLPPWLGVLRKDRLASCFNFHCSRDRKAWKRAKGRQGRGERGQEGERPGGSVRNLPGCSSCGGKQALTLAYLSSFPGMAPIFERYQLRRRAWGIP